VILLTSENSLKCPQLYRDYTPWRQIHHFLAQPSRPIYCSDQWLLHSYFTSLKDINTTDKMGQPYNRHIRYTVLQAISVISPAYNVLHIGTWNTQPRSNWRQSSPVCVNSEKRILVPLRLTLCSHIGYQRCSHGTNFRETGILRNSVEKHQMWLKSDNFIWRPQYVCIVFYRTEKENH
jgi:hypothetical protein